MYHYTRLERAIARIVWEMNKQGIEITEHSVSEFAGRCSPPMRAKPFGRVLETLHRQNLIVLSWKAGVDAYVRYVSPRITEIFGEEPHRFPTSALPDEPDNSG